MVPSARRAVLVVLLAAIGMALAAGPAVADTPNGAPQCQAFIGDSTGTVKAGQPEDVSLRCVDPEGDQLSYRQGRPPAHAALSNFYAYTDATDGAYHVVFSFKPARDYDGPDSFTILIDDGHNHVVEVPFTYTIDNYAPTCRVTDLTTGNGPDLEAGKPATGTYNCYDEEGDPFTVGIKTQPAHGGPVTLTPSDAAGHGGSVSFTPDADYRGSDSFSFVLKDPYQEATVDIPFTVVAPANAQPTCNDISGSTRQPRAVDLTGDCRDGEDETLAYELASQPSHGTVTSDGEGGFTYRPDPDFVGRDTFTYTAVDSGGTKAAPATATVDVTGVHQILVWPEWARAEVGRPHVEFAFVRHADGRAWSGAPVSWKITGSGTGPVLRGTTTANRFGVATVSWTRHAAGLDSANLWIDRNRNRRVDAYEPQAHNVTVTWHERERSR